MGELSFILGSPRVKGGQVLVADVDGRPCRVVECVNRDGVVREWEPDSQLMVGVLDHEDDIRAKNLIAGFLGKLAGSVSGRYGKHDACAVLIGPGGSGVFECKTDAVATVARLYDKGVNTGYRGGEYFRLVRRVSKQAGVVGVMMGWADHECAYQALIVPCPDQLSIQSRLVVDGKDWKRELGELLDMFGKHSDRGLVVVWGSYRADADPAIGVVRGEDGVLQGDPDFHVLPPMSSMNLVGGCTAVGRGVQARWRVLAPKLGVRGLVHTWLHRGGDEL